ncbi:hypothetical protein B0T18DRAFT_398525 [Schizothecium vesticola]|uniref:Uncharacterized protein n=1 Tax=Schizothecium vesticola TaxID=314040 RepID=A0AA40FAC1_9PEZI|nr:hypothetical protein B0T18DRAFT_398525 [Schizothecium vesticola]
MAGRKHAVGFLHGHDRLIGGDRGARQDSDCIVLFSFVRVPFGVPFTGQGAMIPESENSPSLFLMVAVWGFRTCIHLFFSLVSYIGSVGTHARARQLQEVLA